MVCNEGVGGQGIRPMSPIELVNHKCQIPETLPSRFHRISDILKQLIGVVDSDGALAGVV